jgi:long-chain fatty acid transport protein
VTPLLPEAYRNEYTAGLGWSVTDRVDVNVAYQFIDQRDRRGRVVELETENPSAEEIEELNSGLYGFSAHLIGTTLTLHF